MHLLCWQHSCTDLYSLGPGLASLEASVQISVSSTTQGLQGQLDPLPLDELRTGSTGSTGSAAT